MKDRYNNFGTRTIWPSRQESPPVSILTETYDYPSTPRSRAMLAKMSNDSLQDMFKAVLAKQAMDNTEFLAARMEQAMLTAPSGEAAYKSILKAYALYATYQIFEG